MSKRKSIGRIDGMVASVMAFGVIGSKVDAEPSIYETQGLEIF